MKKIILIICLISTNCFAQEIIPTQTKVEGILGRLIVENMDLNTKIEMLNKEKIELKKQIDELKKPVEEKK